jgi:hypothetical protein
MALRRPSIYSPKWLYQDFLYFANGEEESRYIQVKYDGEQFTRTSQTFDYSNPPYSDSEQRGGSIVAQLNYTKVGKIITIDDWTLNWRDEWPLRLAVNYLIECLYPATKGFAIRVTKDAYAFWASEQFVPVTNEPDEYMLRVLVNSGAAANPNPASYSVSVEPNPVGPGGTLMIVIDTENVPLGTPLYWRLSGPGSNPSFFQTGVTSGTVKVGS